MTIEHTLLQRSDSKCELCGSGNELTVLEVPPADIPSADRAILVCNTCHTQITNPASIDTNHWRCLNDSMWSPQPPVQIMAWRMLQQLTAQGELWAQDLLDMLYLDDEMLTWAKAGVATSSSEDSPPTLDSNGTQLQAGDTVTLIKDLDVKGAGFTAKRGTAVRNISLTDNPEHIEGRVNGVRIVLVSKYLKKSS